MAAHPRQKVLLFLLELGYLALQILNLPSLLLVDGSVEAPRATYLIDDLRRFVSFVNWHLWFLLEHSQQAVVSVASHCKRISNILTTER